ncbi:MAG: hypothetical protein UZ09_BCD002001074 [Bacteroidetes bacterium OLB9]|nr:MAG: hypothetical protein UZ09_BCD002001074 [Bacteroidetes bacterium OLB9]
MNIFWKKTRLFFERLFSRSKRVITFPQEEEHDLFIGV